MKSRTKRQRSRTLAFEHLEHRHLLSADGFGFELVSTGENGIGNGLSGNPSISADGRYVAFSSDANNLTANDSNDSDDVFVKDMQTGAITLVSAAADGTQGNEDSRYARISADGNFVAFSSSADNLVPDDINGKSDIFLKNLQTGEVTLVSQTQNGQQGTEGSRAPAISADGRYVAFIYAGNAGTTSPYNIYVKDTQTATLTRANESADGSLLPRSYVFSVSISADGRYVSFDSDDFDLYVKDLESGALIMPDTAADGTPGNSQVLAGSHSLSADGRSIVFGSYSDNLVPDDVNGSYVDVFVKNLETGEVELVSNAWNGDAGDGAAWRGSLSADGRYLSFTSSSTNLVDGVDYNGEGGDDLFVRDLHTGELTQITNLEQLAGTGRDAIVHPPGVLPAISGDGQYVAFWGSPDGFTPEDNNGFNDVFRVRIHEGSEPESSNVNAEVIDHPTYGRVLVINGDEAGNNILISGGPRGAVQIIGSNGTTVNEMDSAVSFANIRHVQLNMDDGSDTVAINDLWIKGRLQVNGGDGDDVVDLTFSQLGSLRMDTGAGHDSVLLDHACIAKTSHILLGAGDDDLTVKDSVFGGDAIGDGGPGDDLLTLLGHNWFFGKKKARQFERRG